MKRVLITGGTGFVGTNLARRLVHDGHAVHLLVRPGYKPWRIEAIRANVRLHELHLHDLSEVTRVVSKIRPEWVFHLAAHGAYSWQTDLNQMVLTNITGTMNLVRACLHTGFEAFVNTGSSSEYGYKDQAPPETELLEPNSHYAVTKASATLFCQYTAQQEKVHLPTLRLYAVYGPYEEPSRLIPTLIIRALQGDLPPLVSPATARDFIYVDDVVEAYLMAASHPGKELGAVYNVGTGVQTTIREVVEIASHLLVITAKPHWGTMPDRIWDTAVWVADNRKIGKQIGWSPRFRFADGLASTLQWFQDNPDLLRLYESRSFQSVI